MSDHQSPAIEKRGRAIDLGFKLLLVALAGLWLVFPRAQSETGASATQTEARR